MAQPEVDGSQLEHGKEVRGVLFVARGEPAEVFDAVEEPLDAVARAVCPLTAIAARTRKGEVGYGKPTFAPYFCTD